MKEKNIKWVVMVFVLLIGLIASGLNRIKLGKIANAERNYCGTLTEKWQGDHMNKMKVFFPKLNKELTIENISENTYKNYKGGDRICFNISNEDAGIYKVPAFYRICAGLCIVLILITLVIIIVFLFDV